MSQIPTYHSLLEASAHLRAPVVTIGNFDGAHRGHQAVFARVRELANARQSEAVALSFTPHPVRYFRPELPPFRLSTDAQKAELMGRYGLDALVLLPFNAALAHLSPKEFVQQVLRDGLHACRVVVGEGFAFGKGRAGRTEELIELCAHENIEVEIAQNIRIDHTEISSTRVRKALESADLAEVTRMLGRPYEIEGTVVRGDQRGRDLGFPTANIDSLNPLLPPNGIYISELTVERLGTLRSLTSIGTRPTFNGKDVRVETFVLDGQAEKSELELYGKSVKLSFRKFLRSEVEFESVEALVAQMHDDVAQAMKYYNSAHAD